ncbi:MAG TPA: WecB/TagA/CpsF family glycosyltransferase [Pantanalinema sp.]
MRVNVLGFPIDPLGVDDAIARVQAATPAQPLQVVTINAEMAIQGMADPELGDVLRGAGLVLPDGSGVVWAIRRQGRPVQKLAGVEFVGHMAEWCAANGKRMYLFGAGEGVAATAAATLTARYPGLEIAGVRSGFFAPEEEGAIFEEIRAARPDVLLVALGVPRQEKWIQEHQALLGVPVAMGVGGSFDVLADRVKRAPLAFRRLHLEWLFRLIQEPWRWRRMSATLPRFAWLVLSEKLGENRA